MKKETLQTLTIIVMCLAFCFAGCERTPAIVLKPKVEKTQRSSKALIQYESGMVEYITDSFHIGVPRDTVVIIHYSALQADSSVLQRDFIWGFPNADDTLPQTISDDSLYVEFNKVVVLRTEHRCIDPTHRTCDGTCVCDGMECPK